MKRLSKEIKKKRRLISTLEETLDSQQEQLREVTKAEAIAAQGRRKDGDDDIDDSDSDSDDDSGQDVDDSSDSSDSNVDVI
jgi:hypothetical protein